MLKDKYRSKLNSSISRNKIYLVVMLLVLISNIFLSYKILTIEIDEKTIIHPFSAQKEYSIEDDEVDPYYLESFAKEFLQGRFIYNPKTVHKQFDNLTKHFHPVIYSQKKSELDIKADSINRKEESSVFFPMSTHVKGEKVYVTGELTGYIGKKHVRTRKKTFEISFRNSGGRVWLYDWQEVVLDARGKRYIPVKEAA